MKVLHKHLGLILVLFFSFSVMAQKQKPPPGTGRLKPSETGVKHATFIDHTEVTAQYWLDFLFWTKLTYGEESPEYKAIMPDSLICVQVAIQIDSSHYFPYYRLPIYRHLPIVGITYEQAIAYCAWRSDRVNESLELLRVKNKRNKKKYGYTVTYSLPTEADFAEAYKQQKIKTNQKELTNAVEYRCRYYKINGKICRPKKSGIKYIADNAQEFTAEKTVLRGENAEKLMFEPYQGANAMTGFRCVAEITK